MLCSFGLSTEASAPAVLSLIYSTHNYHCCYLWVTQEGVLVVDAASSTPPFPLSVERLLMPGLRQREERRVDLATDADVCEPVGPVMKLHPM